MPCAAQTAPPRALLDQYCVTCHNQRLKTGGVMFDKMDIANVGPDAKIWEEAVRKVQGGLMPPPGAPQPNPAAKKAFISSLETSLDEAAAKNPDPGHVAMHRLNRTEYANAINEILGLKVDATTLLPVDDISDGFDNIANVLKVSPSFLDQYISAARMVTTTAIGSASPTPLTISLRPPVGSIRTVTSKVCRSAPGEASSLNTSFPRTANISSASAGSPQAAMAAWNIAIRSS